MNVRSCSFSRSSSVTRSTSSMSARTRATTPLPPLPNLALRVTAYEPEPANFERLMANPAANGSLDRVEALRVAVSSTSELVRLGMPPEGRMLSGGRLPSSVVGLEPGLAFIDVPTVALDAALAGVDVVKVDVEGAEGDVVAGAANVLSRCAPTLLMECWPLNPQTNAADALLWELGYSFFRVMPDGPMRVDPLGSRVHGTTTYA